MRPPYGGVECRWGWQKSRFSVNDRWLLECEQQLRRSTVQFTAQTATHQWVLFITNSMDDHDEKKRTEHNLIVRRGKPEAEVTNNRRLFSMYCTIEANYWQIRCIARPVCDSRATERPTTTAGAEFVMQSLTIAEIPVIKRATFTKVNVRSLFVVSENIGDHSETCQAT